MWGLNLYALVFQVILRVLYELLLCLRCLSYYDAASDLLIGIIQHRYIGPGSFEADFCLNYCLRILRCLRILLQWLHNLFAFLLLLNHVVLGLLWFWNFCLQILVSDRDRAKIVHLWFKLANFVLFLVLYLLLLSINFFHVFLLLSKVYMLLTHQNLIFYLWGLWVRSSKAMLCSCTNSWIALNLRIIHVYQSSLVAQHCNSLSHF